jgi:hypothetical protein
MSASSHFIALPEALVHDAAERAGQLGVSTEKWIELALSERLRVEKMTADFFAVRAARATGRSLGEILDQAGDNPPDPGDELEELDA